MIDMNQIVKVRWNPSNRKWYECKGYKYTKQRDEFEVFVKDLSYAAKVRINVICDYCGEEYDAWFYSVMYGREKYPKDCCANCTGKKSSDVSRMKRARKKIGCARKICDELGYIFVTTEDEYIDVHMDVVFICPIHGIQTMMLDNFLRGHKCIKCSYEYRASGLRYSQDYVKESIESVNDNKWLNYGEYTDIFNHNLTILCSCGNKFITSFANYTKHGVMMCYSCSCKESSGERRIRDFLEQNNIKFEQEKRFDDCRDKKPLPFDFYLPDYNLIVEFDGRHHYEDIGFVNYEITVMHDNIKNDYCKSHNINLLRIPYWEWHNIESILKEKLVYR